MTKDVFTQWAEIGAKTIESLENLSTINGQIAERLFAQQKKALDEYIHAGISQINLLSKPKSLDELCTDQAQLISTNNEKFIALAKESTEITEGAHKEWGVWIEKGVDAATTSLSQAAKKAA